MVEDRSYFKGQLIFKSEEKRVPVEKKIFMSKLAHFILPAGFYIASTITNHQVV